MFLSKRKRTHNKQDIRTQLGFSALYKEHVKFVFDTCYCYLRDVDESENITSDIFTSIWERRETLNKETWEGDSWKRYLSKAVKNKVYNHIRIRNQNKTYVARVTSEFIPSQNMTEEDFQFGELADQIDTLMEQLLPKCQHVFKLSREHGMPHKEIAEHLSISDNAVKKHVSKALNYFREHLDDYKPPNRVKAS